MVLTVPTIEGEPIETFVLRVAETWKPGHKGLDNGLLLVIASQDRQARIEVGYGLEGAVPDVIAKRVLEDVMFPRFRAGDPAGGIEAAVAALISAARGEEIPQAMRPRPRSDLPGGDPLSLVFFAALVASLMWMPFRGGSRRSLGAMLGGLTASGIVFLVLQALGWAALAFVLGTLFGWIGPAPPGARRRSGFGWGPGYGGWSGGGGGGFGGGGASGRW